MPLVEINWIKNEAIVCDKNRRGRISIEGMRFVDEDELKNQIIAMVDRDEINMIEEGTENVCRFVHLPHLNGEYLRAVNTLRATRSSGDTPENIIEIEKKLRAWRK